MIYTFIFFLTFYWSTALKNFFSVVIVAVFFLISATMYIGE